MSQNGVPPNRPFEARHSEPEGSDPMPSRRRTQVALPFRAHKRSAPPHFPPFRRVPRREVLEDLPIVEAVGRVAVRVAHHLNNHLTVVEGHLWHLENSLENEQFSAELKSIREAYGHISALSSQLLSVGGCRWGQSQTIDVRSLVSGMDLGRLFSGELVFCTDFAATACPVRVDPTHLEDALLGLVMNAREALDDHGTVRVGIDLVDETNGNGIAGRTWVQIEVSDSGKGMDPETLSRALHPFFSTRPFSEGRGLGLSLACGMARQWGGSLSVSSAAARGTTVCVRLPADTGPTDPPTTAE